MVSVPPVTTMLPLDERPIDDDVLRLDGNVPLTCFASITAPSARIVDEPP